MQSRRFLLVLVGCPGRRGALALPASAQNTVKLAIVAEITGGGAPSGTMWRDGVILAVEEINKKGGMLGRPLETFVQDTQSDPPTSVAVMRRAINEQALRDLRHGVQLVHRGQHGDRPPGRHSAVQRLGVGARRDQGQ